MNCFLAGAFGFTGCQVCPGRCEMIEGFAPYPVCRAGIEGLLDEPDSFFCVAGPVGAFAVACRDLVGDADGGGELSLDPPTWSGSDLLTGF
ncbi:hypothetical protein ACFQ2K_09570 [Streptomyces sanglieri]|uniref:Uncharacterized protein n=1 Tax=Streptomyces sanglieri TaxID=193460 RepID=A0ABW2WNA1_9ACTN